MWHGARPCNHSFTSNPPHEQLIWQWLTTGTGFAPFCRDLVQFEGFSHHFLEGRELSC